MLIKLYATILLFRTALSSDAMDRIFEKQTILWYNDRTYIYVHLEYKLCNDYLFFKVESCFH